MVLSQDVRQQKISNLSKSGNSDQRQKLFYKNETQSFDVFRIDLDWLVFNRHNGRLEAEMLTWEQEHAAAPDVYDDELHDVLGNLLWNSNVAKNKQTLKDLASKKQLKPGIISLDGVVIDGNRRFMLLRRLEEQTQTKQYFDAVILPDAYADNQKEIVRLETQYQLGEDAKVEYGPLQKYLHARRLNLDLGIPESEIDLLMGEKPGTAKRLLGIMDLMDDYLDHIGCPRLYTMLKDSGGTKEGMFVDLFNDLKRLNSGNAKIPWNYDPELDPLQLKLIHFDYARFGGTKVNDEFSDPKTLRVISHNSKGKNFFANEEIWERFSSIHANEVSPARAKLGSLEDFIAAHPDNFETKVDAARHRDRVWAEEVKAPMQAAFGTASYELGMRLEELLPNECLKRAKDLMDRIDVESSAVTDEPSNKKLALEINSIIFEIKRQFEKLERRNGSVMEPSDD